MLEKQSVSAIDMLLAQEGQPLPEIVLPQTIALERENGINNLLDNPPSVDCLHVLGRSGTLAATGLYENPGFAERLCLPPLFPIDGVGNELWTAYTRELYDQLRDEDVPDQGIGDEGNDEDRERFFEWLSQLSHPQLQKTIEQLRAVPQEFRSIGILDDLTQTGNVARGIAPAVYRLAYGSDFSYTPENNRYLFSSANWLEQIITASFGTEQLNIRQLKFLKEVAKGATDWLGMVDGQDTREDALMKHAQYFATAYLGNGSNTALGTTVYDCIQRYGRNIFNLHESIQEALRLHTAQVVLKKK